MQHCGYGLSFEMPDFPGEQFIALMSRCAIKYIAYETIDAPKGSSVDTNVVCYLETEHAFADSLPAVCITEPAAKEEASRNMLDLIKLYGGEDKINNLAGRSSSPASPVSPRNLLKAKSYEGRSLSESVPVHRRRSVVSVMKSVFKKKQKKK